MTLEALLNTCAQSTPDDWNLMPAWGSGAGPSYLSYPPHFVAEVDDEDHRWSVDHHMRASYGPDISIGLAWGLTSRTSWNEEWANQFPDPEASSHFVDFLYNGMLVDRHLYVIVDGGRAYLPAPGHRDGEHVITRWQYQFFGLLDSLERHHEYVQRAGFQVV